MARYPGSSQGMGRTRIRNRILFVLSLLVLVVLIALAYGPGPFGKQDKASEDDDIRFVVESNSPDLSGAEVDEANDLATVAVEVFEPVVEANVVEVDPSISGIAPNPEAEALISEAMSLISAKPSRAIEARDILNRTLGIPMSGKQRKFVKEQLSSLADQWLLSRKIFPEDPLCGTYKVVGGDHLSVIGREYKVPYELLMKINRIPRAELLRLGDTIKVVNGPFHAKVYRSTFTMDLYLKDTFVRSFKVGLGKDGMDTPTGLWAVKVDGKLVEPPWPDPVSGKILHAGDPGYALGSRWIGLDGLEGDAKGRTGFGIHGTKDPESIGTASSRGCVRLHNGNAIFVYDLLVPVHSQVTVED